MKKLLSLLGALTMSGSVASTVLACGTSEKTSVDNSQLVNSDYSITTQHFATNFTQDTNPLEIFEKQLRGYINPILFSMIGHKVDNIDEQYQIKGLNIENILRGIESINNSSDEAASFTFPGITIDATSAATVISGSTTLARVSLVKGWHISSIFDMAIEDMVIPTEHYKPTMEEVLKYLNQHIKHEVKERVSSLTAGHLQFGEPQRGKIIVSGQGSLHSTVPIGFESSSAVDISQVIKNTELGEVEFKNLPSEQKLIDAINEKNEIELNINDVFVDRRTTTQTQAIAKGLRYFKGTTNLTYQQAPIDLGKMNGNLGHLNFVPSALDILETFNKVNEDLGLTVLDVDIQVTGDQQALITARPESDRAKGSIMTTWVDIRELEATISEARQVLASSKNPNPDAEKRLKLYIATSEIVMRDNTASQSDVNAAVQLLRQEMRRFQDSTKTDYSQLVSLIVQANQVILENRNPNAEAELILKTEITKSQNIVDANNSTQAEVDVAVKVLMQAIKDFQLATRTDYTQLIATIKVAFQAISDNKNPNAEAEQILRLEITKAQAIVDANNSTQAQVNDARQILLNAIETFRNTTKTDYTRLIEIIRIAEEAIANNKNPNSELEIILRTEIAKAQRVIDEGKSSQVEVDEIVIKLREAKERFEEATKTDFTQLLATIQAAKDAITNNINPNATAQATLELAISQAQVVANNVDSSQAEVDSANATLEIEIKKFQEITRTDFSELLATIKAANDAIANNKNPNASAEASLKLAILQAQGVADNERATQIQVDEGTKTLQAAIDIFLAATKSNFEVLIATIQVAEDTIANNTNPNPVAEAALRGEMGIAQAMVDEGRAGQSEVDEEVVTLRNAIQVFLEATKTDFTKLLAKISEAQTILESVQNPNPVAEADLKLAITQAQLVVDIASATQAQVDEAVASLQAAIDKFLEETKSDFSVLIETIRVARNTISQNRNPNPVAEASLTLEITKAQAMVDEGRAGQSEVDAAVVTLQQAIQDFLEATKTDYSVLIEHIKLAINEIVYNPNPNPEAERILRLEIAKAQQMVDEAISSQEEVNQAVVVIKEAITKFKESVKTDFSKLEATIQAAHDAIANSVNPNPAAQATLEAAIAAAQVVLGNSEAIQSQVDIATATLQAEIDKFIQATRTDFSKLIAMIEAATQILESGRGKNPSADAQLQAAITVATAVRNNVNASQQEVDITVEMLRAAIEEYKEAGKSDTSKLQDVINRAQAAIDEHGHKHPIEAAVLKLAINAAQLVLDNVAATEEEINLAVETLEKALDTFLSVVGISSVVSSLSI